MQRSTLLRIIRKLPTRAPLTDGWWPPYMLRMPNRQHWLGWLEEYDGPGHYRRRSWRNRDARFVYNHLHCPPMLCWLAEHAGVSPGILALAYQAAGRAFNDTSGAAAFRKQVPWNTVLSGLSRRPADRR